jgi:hypothetical protein
MFQGGPICEELQMAWYRLYFLSSRGDIRNVDEFDVASDNDALMMADLLHDSVRDIYAGWELWQGSRTVFRCPNEAAQRPYVPRPITTRMQALILRHQEKMQESQSAFARSARLLERIREVREIVGPRRKHSAK